jgi:hypothetical protein
MFGNRLGWSLAAGILLFAAYVCFLTWQAGHTTPPTGWVASTVHSIGTPRGAEAVVPMTQSADAAPLYATAIADDHNRIAEYDALENGRLKEPAAPLAGVAALVHAMPRQKMNLFRRAPQGVVTYDAEKPPLLALLQVAKVTALLGMDQMHQDNLEEAGNDFAGVYALGLKLFQERVDFAELSAGEELMGLGAGGLQRLAKRQGNTDMVLSLASLDADRLARFDSDIQPVWAVISSIDQNSMADSAGDMFQLATDRSAELPWRVEATLHLGRLKYDAGRRADEVAAQQLLTQMAADDSEEPAVRTAAAAGRDLTLEQYRTLH